MKTSASMDQQPQLCLEVAGSESVNIWARKKNKKKTKPQQAEKHCSKPQQRLCDVVLSKQLL